MRLDDQRESDNVEDRRGGGIPGGVGGAGIGVTLLALVASYFLGVNPSTLLNLASQTGLSTPQPAPAHKPPADDKMARFVSKVLADTEDTWSEIFKKNGKVYQKPKLVLFTGSTPTACGAGRAAMGPFYCPGDRKVYIDLAFYRELDKRFHAPGQFAQAYVIAHEIGHHVQTLLGISEKVHALEAKARGKAEANAYSVKLELQADCFAGVWGYRAEHVGHRLEPGEVEQALKAASAIGDDTLQKQAKGYAVPDSFTHGSADQRVRWFKRGMESGDVNQCNTFKAGKL